MALPDLKTSVGDMFAAKVTRVNDLKETQFGKSALCNVVKDGQEYSLFVKEKNYGLFQLGAILTFIRKKYQGKDYFEIFAGGPAPIEKNDLPPQARAKEVNLNGRGASWNNAFAYCLQGQEVMTKKDLPNFLIDVKEVAEQITTAQENFVQNKSNAVVTDYTDKIPF